VYLESKLHNIKTQGAFQKVNETCKCEHFIFCNAHMVFYFDFSDRKKSLKKEECKSLYAWKSQASTTGFTKIGLMLGLCLT
jgi:hypothetical protein